MTNSIERILDLNAPIGRVWQALADYKEFGSWFQLDLQGPFQVGKITTGKVTSSCHHGLPFWMRLETLEQPKRFSFVWPMDETVSPDDPDLQNKVTLVEFTLEPKGDRTRMTLRESGFDKLPDNKGINVFRMNEGGWTMQMNNIKSYVE
ncbi:SRPBCC family protein [Kiloniella laminariae]|uniref:SRPBCC family protein n=1 Tax=Kiloniella laminariae TaxID=454162 RepID=A0ABT4LDR9_9PROT|nr:SRPBCC family protein [Kiloniella laminariae]MCZ4279253.1 SRPBCC family protein [Kiloniella laminariae]